MTIHNPIGWERCKLSDILTLKNGFAFKSSEYKDSGIPILRISDIQEGSVSPSNAKCIDENENFDEYVVNKGDILIAMSGATTGKFGIYDSELKAYQNQRVGRFSTLVILLTPAQIEISTNNYAPALFTFFFKKRY